MLHCCWFDVVARCRRINCYTLFTFGCFTVSMVNSRSFCKAPVGKQSKIVASLLCSTSKFNRNCIHLRHIFAQSVFGWLEVFPISAVKEIWQQHSILFNIIIYYNIIIDVVLCLTNLHELTGVGSCRHDTSGHTYVVSIQTDGCPLLSTESPRVESTRADTREFVLIWDHERICLNDQLLLLFNVHLFTVTLLLLKQLCKSIWKICYNLISTYVIYMHVSVKWNSDRPKNAVLIIDGVYMKIHR